MAVSERQDKILNALIREYISAAKPVSSKLLKERANLDFSPATIRNDLQELTAAGFISQPHTSAGRVPTKKAYKYFAEKFAREQENEFENFIVRQIRFAHEEMEQEMKFMEDLMQTLENDNMFEILKILDTWHKKMRDL